MTRVPATMLLQFSTGIAVELSTDASLGAGAGDAGAASQGLWNRPQWSDVADLQSSIRQSLCRWSPAPLRGRWIGSRPAPAYVHARTQVRSGSLIDLNNDPTRPDVNDTVSRGNYRALHYVDFTGDGQVSVTVRALAGKPEVATSVVKSLLLTSGGAGLFYLSWPA
ncbi:MAG: hypothetical protein KF890_00430 [Nitrospira sp.]|nr:hypothetical protein [Nitrospira sp.]